MSKYNITANQNLYSLLRLLDSDEDTDITLKFSTGSDVYKNSLNLKTLKKLAEDREKNLKFEVENVAHKDYIDAVNGDYIEYNEEEVNLEDAAAAANGASLFSKFSGMFKRSKPQAQAVEDEYVTPGVSSDEQSEDFSTESSVPEYKKGNSKRKKIIKAIVIVIISLLFIASSAWAFFWYVPTAVVKINIDTKDLIKLIDVKASTSQEEVDSETMVIPAFSVETTETDSEKIPTTGKKEVGEKAEGKVKITNKTDKKIEIKKGAELKLISSDKDSLLYITKDKIEIDGYTKDAEDNEVYSSKEVEIEASSFGGDYNLDKTEKFKVSGKDTDDVLAENTEDIKGGSSEEVSVVAQADLDQLKRVLEEAMESNVKQGLSRKLVGGQVMQEASIEFSVVSATYSNQLDEETDEVSLQMTMAGKVLAYDSSSLDTLMKEIVSSVVPESFKLNEENPEYEVAATSVSNGTDVNLQVKLTSSITPRLEQDKIKEDLSGMSIEQAQSYLDDLNDVKGFEISISPNLPGIFLRMPQRSENIDIKINN